MTRHECVRPWRELVEQDLRTHLASEMYSFNLSHSAHDFEYIKYAEKEWLGLDIVCFSII